MLWRFLNLVGVALFGYATVVQRNDPDPVRWMVLYGAAAAFCLLAVFGRAPRMATGTFAASAAVFAMLWALGTSWGDDPLADEQVRETLGLGLVAGWMAALFLMPRGRAPSQQSDRIRG